MSKYSDVPMDYTDATLVAAGETLGIRDFRLLPIPLRISLREYLPDGALRGGKGGTGVGKIDPPPGQNDLPEGMFPLEQAAEKDTSHRTDLVAGGRERQPIHALGFGITDARDAERRP
jgi:hypothetical protein